MKNPETEAAVSPGNCRGCESRAAGVGGQGTKRWVTLSANLAKWYTANRVDLSLHAMTGITQGKRATLRLEFSETLSRLGVKERAQLAGLLQHEVGSKVSASLCRMCGIIWLPPLPALITSFLWCLGEGVVTVTCCWLHSFLLSWHGLGAGRGVMPTPFMLESYMPWLVSPAIARSCLVS